MRLLVLGVGARALGDDLAAGIEGPPAAVADHHVSRVAEDRRPFGLVVELVGGPDPHLVEDRRLLVGVVEGHELGVGELLHVVEVALAAGGRGGCRHAQGLPPLCHHRGFQAAPGHVEPVDAVVAQVAGPVIEEPAPVAVESHRVERPLRRRPEPGVVIDPLGDRGVGRPADRALLRRSPRRGRRVPCRSPPRAGSRSPRRSGRRSATGRPSGRRGRTCGRPRPSAGPRGCRARRASPRRRACPPGSRRPSGSRASGPGSRRSAHRYPCRRAPCGSRRRPSRASSPATPRRGPPPRGGAENRRRRAS